MLEQIKSNDIHSSGTVKTPQTSYSRSSVEVIELTENNEAKLKIITTTDVLTDVLSNVISVLLNIEILHGDDNLPKFILRESKFDDNKNEHNSQLVAMWRISQENAIRTCLSAYQFAINNNMDSNKAASILPVGNTMIVADIMVGLGSIMENTYKGMSSESIEIIHMAQKEISNNGQ